MKFRLRITKDTVNLRVEPRGYEKDLALDWFIYVPFVGWLYPFLLKKDNAFSMYHGVQAFCLAVLFTAIPVVLSFSTVFIAVSLREVRLAVVIFIYISHAAYLGLAIWGTLMVRRGQQGSFPLLTRYIQRMNIMGAA